MKKQSKLLSLVTALTLTASLVVPVLADSAAIDGEGEVNSPVLSVEVPTNLNFKLDPLKISSTSQGQVLAGNYVIANNTADVKVLAAFYLDIALGEDVTLMTNAAAVTANFDFTATDKKLAFGIVPALTMKAGDTDIDTYAAVGTVTYFDSDSSDVSVGFALDSDGESDVSGFSFYGALNAYAEWEASDVKVSGVYLLKPIAAATTVTPVGSTLRLIDKSATPLPAKPVVAASILKLTGGAAATAYSISYPKLKNDGLKIELDLSTTGHPGSITSATWGTTNMISYITPAYNPATGIVTFKVDWTSETKPYTALLKIVAGGQTFQVNLTATLS